MKKPDAGESQQNNLEQLARSAFVITQFEDQSCEAEGILANKMMDSLKNANGDGNRMRDILHELERALEKNLPNIKIENLDARTKAYRRISEISANYTEFLWALLCYGYEEYCKILHGREIKKQRLDEQTITDKVNELLGKIETFAEDLDISKKGDELETALFQIGWAITEILEMHAVMRESMPDTYQGPLVSFGETKKQIESMRGVVRRTGLYPKGRRGKLIDILYAAIQIIQISINMENSPENAHDNDARIHRIQQQTRLEAEAVE